MKRQRRQRQVEVLRDHARVQAVRTVLDEQAKDRQAAFLGEGGQGGDSGFVFHISNIMKIWRWAQDHGMSEAMRRMAQ